MSTPSVEVDGLFQLHEEMVVHAPIERCFKLSCSVALVREELKMRAVSGCTSGLVRGGDVIRWEGWQLGMLHHHVSQISSYQSPVFLQDTMLDGRFKLFQHDHHLQETTNGTLLSDDLRFSLPFGLLGRFVARTIVLSHIRRLLKSRFARIKRIAEGDDWKEYLVADEQLASS